MSPIAFAAGFAIFIWWFSTGLVFVVARRGERNERLVAIAATVVAMLALGALYVSARWDTTLGTYLGFGSALLLWAWHELMFLLGIIVGPRRFAATPGLKGEKRFREAFAAVRDHELAIAATALIVIALTVGGSNAVGVWTFMLLWVMRISAKLTIFLGARNSLSEMMPPRLGYLKSYFRTDRTTWFLPVVIVVGLAVFVWLCGLTGAATEVHQTVGFALLAALLGLAILEHVFLMLPISDAVLWLWAAPSKNSENKTRPATQEGGVARNASKGEGVSWT